MISLVNKIPKIRKLSAEAVKINCIYNAYKDIALFWTQNKSQAVISMLDGNMVIYNNEAEIDELSEFINVVSPQSVFSDEKTLAALFGDKFDSVCVLKSDYKFKCEICSDTLNSSEIYNLLDVEGITLPSYEPFAVDFCHRLNHGQLKYFALKNKCAAIGICDGHATLVNGIASHQKGMGSMALSGLLSQYNLPALVVCKKSVMPFYLKNNFSHIYNAGYWRKTP